MSKIICLDISVLSDDKKTGIGVYTYQLIKALLKINKKDKFILFGIATFQTFDYLKSIEFKDYPNVTLKVYKYPARFFRNSFLIWQRINWPKIEKLVGKVDIFHSFNWYLPPQKFGKTVATFFDMTPLLLPEFHQEKTIQLDKIRFTRIKNLADLTLTISENSKKDFLKFAPDKKLEVIYPAVSESFSKKTNKKEVTSVLKKYKLAKGYILCIGTLEPRKNMEILIKAYLKSNLSKKLVLVGKEGWKNGRVLKLINSNKEKIITTGYIEEDDLPYIYNQALYLVYPTLYEGFGIPVLEAMRSETPVITSDNSSLREVGGEAVFYIDPTNENNIKEALVNLSKNKALRERLIKRGLVQAKKFSWEKSAKKLNDLYQRVIETKENHTSING